MRIAIPLFDRFTALDAVGPYEVLSRLPGAHVHWLAGAPGPVRTGNDMLGLVADAAYEDLPDPEIVLVPGGLGTRVLLDDERIPPVLQRGRPTTVLGPHAAGPLVLAAELREGDWRLALAGIDGLPLVIAQDRYAGEEWDVVLPQLANAIGAIYRKNTNRIRAVAVSVAGPISGTALGQIPTRGWAGVDLSALTAKIPGRAGVRLLLGSDATLAGLAGWIFGPGGRRLSVPCALFSAVRRVWRGAPVQVVPAAAGALSEAMVASPKSRSLTRPSSVTMTLPGLRSRWTMPRS